MSSLCCCFRKASEGDAGCELATKAPTVTLDRNGPAVVVSGGVVSGDGIASASTAIEQDACYWEIHVVRAGSFRAGVGRSHSLAGDALAGPLGDGQSSWALASDDADLSDGDVLGVAFTQADLPNLSFYINGELSEKGQVTVVRGEVCPAASVSGDAKLRFVFDETQFKHEAPRPHSALQIVRSLI